MSDCYMKYAEMSAFTKTDVAFRVTDVFPALCIETNPKMMKLIIPVSPSWKVNTALSRSMGDLR